MKQVIPKPVGSQWTNEQWQAISARGQNILVAAAAGSGKTAVLVERIIRRIADETSPVDVDRLFVATFTKAAASEMKGRIREALDKELSKKPYSVHLRRQLLLLTRASISTLHSFCMDVVKRYSYTLDLDPAFRVADELEAKLLRQDVMDALFEEEYAAGNHGGFYTLVDWYSSDRSDAELQRLVMQLHDFSQSHPYPEHWLEEMVAMYRVEDREQFEQLPWIKEMRNSVEIRLMKAIALLQSAIEVAQLPGGPAPYLENLQSELQQFEAALECSNRSWEELERAVRNIEFSRLKSCRAGDVYDQALIDQARNLREDAKKCKSEIIADAFARSPQEMIDELTRMEPVMQALVALVKKFAHQFRLAKLEKGLVDFADLEHYCLQILRHPDSTPDQLLPSEIAQSYQQHFEEILVDEYQDTNLVQESILHLIARPVHNGGNRFMVGDVKQSIYRFRLTEPKLFLEKYNQYRSTGDGVGLRIDLSKNFRSRAEVLLGTNYIFRQIMRADVAELDYDEAAELVLGAQYPELATNPIELQLLDRNLERNDDDDRNNGDGERSVERNEELDLQSDDGFEEYNPEELENAELEARWIATRIREMISGGENGAPYQVYDRTRNGMRNVQYRDIVILLRSTNRAAPLMLEEFRLQGIPAYAEVSQGYFSATEIEIMLSLLKIIDNPYQDIPLAAVLRSPIVQLTAEEMAQLRLVQDEGNYYDALTTYIERDADEVDEPLQMRLKSFHKLLELWRMEARQGALSDLIWRIYQETGYYDYVGGLPGGKERQANLRALYDRARTFEQSAYRGLFRFLRFVERMQERGEEMGVARALGEQEDVVRIMTIHKSKGLEFPVVFIAGLAKQFNMQEIHRSFLYHKELGFGSKWVDTDLRVTYPTLPLHAIRARQQMELLAEEQRLLYVAMTRAKEKLILVGTLRNAAASIEKWRAALSVNGWQLPPHLIATSKTYVDWIGPALMRHAQATTLLQMIGESTPASMAAVDPSQWFIQITKADRIIQSKKQESIEDVEAHRAIQEGRPIASIGEVSQVIADRLSWKYPYLMAERSFAKQSVSEIKRKWQAFEQEEEQQQRSRIHDRPRFLEEKGLTPAERGTAMHMVMQQFDLQMPMTIESIQHQIDAMVEKELLTLEQASAIKIEHIVSFFASEVGQRMLKAKQVLREIPFSFVLSAHEVYGEKWQEHAPTQEEQVLLQGIIDVLIEEEHGWTLLDYKTDATWGISDEELLERYRVQIQLYSRAIESICRQPLVERILYFFNGQRVIQL